MRKRILKFFGLNPARQAATRRERGATIVMATLGFVTFLLAAGMAVDISHFYLAGTELQNAADAAALAGASALDSTSAGIKKATDNAVLAMNKFEFDKVSVTIARGNVLFANNLNDLNGAGGLTEAQATASPTNVRFIKVQVPPKDVGVFFAKFALNANTVSLTRTAVAGQSESGAPGDVTPNEICNLFRLTLVEGTQTDFDNGESLDRTSDNPGCGSSFEYTPGCSYNVHMTPPCDAQLSYYEILENDGGKTFTDWDDRIASRVPGSADGACFWGGQVVPAYTHPKAANIKNGLHTMFGTYGGGLTSTNFPPDLNVKQNITYAEYKTAVQGSANFQPPPGNLTGVAGRRILVLPIIQKSSFVVLDAAGEKADMTISRFGAFFIKKKAVINTKNNTADLVLEYIGDRVTTGGGRVNPARPMNNTIAKGLAVPVLYR